MQPIIEEDETEDEEEEEGVPLLAPIPIRATPPPRHYYSPPPAHPLTPIGFVEPPPDAEHGWLIKNIVIILALSQSIIITVLGVIKEVNRDCVQ